MGYNLVINGTTLPEPDRGFKVVVSTMVNAGRSASGVMRGQKLGREIYKLDGLKWSFLSPQEWSSILQLVKPFYVNVTFTNPETNRRLTIQMYPGDRDAEPLRANNGTVEMYRNCKLNLIDVGA
jgi:hypothetical protein